VYRDAGNDAAASVFHCGTASRLWRYQLAEPSTAGEGRVGAEGEDKGEDEEDDAEDEGKEDDVEDEEEEDDAEDEDEEHDIEDKEEPPPQTAQ
jgi:hypothetical protein